MTDYISREALLERVCEVRDKLSLDLNTPFEDGVRIGIENVEIEIENLPAADVREVKRGKWIAWYSAVRCTECGRDTIRKTHYCPNCGADMREES